MSRIRTGRTVAGEREKHRRDEARRRSAGYFDYGLLFFILFLVAFGLVMLYSTSSYVASVHYGDSAYYLKRQFAFALLGLGIMFIVSRVPYHFWYRFAFAVFAFSLLLNVMVLFMGQSSNGSQRWLAIGPIRFQPSELAKVSVIIFVSYIVSRAPRKMAKFSNVVKVFALMLPMIGLVAYSNLSTGIIVAGIVFILLFVASPKYKDFIAIILLAAAGAAVFLMTFSYRLERVKVWLHPESNPDKAYQTIQGLYAIGSGGLFGKGLGESLQKLSKVPEPQNDMIFSIICEELGLFGAICIILLFVLLIWRLMLIANNTQDLFGSLLVIGIMAHIALQVTLNIAVATNSMPNTGITLPFISYGGSSLLILLGEMGIALSVSRGIHLVDLNSELPRNKS